MVEQCRVGAVFNSMHEWMNSVEGMKCVVECRVNVVLSSMYEWLNSVELMQC